MNQKMTLKNFIKEANDNKETGEKYSARMSGMPLKEFNENGFLNFPE